MSKTLYLLLLFLAPCLGALAQQSPAYAAIPARPAAAAVLANLPDCTDPRGLAATEMQGDGFVLVWQGRPAQPGETEYRVRHRSRHDKSGAWAEQRVTQGLSAKIQCAVAGPVEVEVQKICYLAFFGGQICLPPPSTPGFDTNGIHNVTGLPWDEYGFGPDGTYDKDPPYPGYQARDSCQGTEQLRARQEGLRSAKQNQGPRDSGFESQGSRCIL